MSAGLCPVVNDVGGNAAVLGPALAHRLVADASPERVAAAWEAALRDREARDRDGAAARRRVIERYGIDATLRRYREIYDGRSALAPPVSEVAGG